MDFSLFDANSKSFFRGTYDGYEVRFNEKVAWPIVLDSILFNSMVELAPYIKAKLEEAQRHQVSKPNTTSWATPAGWVKCPKCQRDFRQNAMVVFNLPNGGRWESCEGCWNQLLERDAQWEKREDLLKRRENQLLRISRWLCAMTLASQQPDAIPRLAKALRQHAEEIDVQDAELHASLPELKIP